MQFLSKTQTRSNSANTELKSHNLSIINKDAIHYSGDHYQTTTKPYSYTLGQFCFLAQISIPNSLSKYQPQAPLVNLITLLAWVPLYLLQPAAWASGSLDGHCSIIGDHMDRWDARQTLQFSWNGRTMGLSHMTLPWKPEHKHRLGPNFLGAT